MQLSMLDGLHIPPSHSLRTRVLSPILETWKRRLRDGYRILPVACGCELDLNPGQTPKSMLISLHSFIP